MIKYLFLLLFDIFLYFSAPTEMNRGFMTVCLFYYEVFLE